ncbi:DUF2399 domain-containing protein [Paenibacillus lutimineralis]|uniref:DUF2399 domain-containing protein n=1 Tax=Paenibacillus lutimineralis TaxID=2707005 RepID=UPI0013A62A67|nr:DUF2399 domain-containing protein [Paenibacillus lutimineralis]
MGTIIDIPVVKRTVRTYRQVGILTLTTDMQQWQDTSVPDVDLLKWTPGRRATLEDEQQAFEWLSAGWIIKEMRLKRDGKTTDKLCYRMGYRLFALQWQRQDQERTKLAEQLESCRSRAARLQRQGTSVIQNERKTLISLLQSRLIAHSSLTIDELEGAELFQAQWSNLKRIQFLHFILAFILVSNEQDVFDWKEIGARYYKEIGGSKVFDTHKDEFIRTLELWAGQSATHLGLISPGQITPIYFSGPLEGQWSVHRPGPVHALTDISAVQDDYHTSASTLWLVENRGILTRIAADQHFAEKSNCLIICVDGHIRSSHKMLIHRLVANNSINQVLMWSDYDEDGFGIAREMMEAVSASKLMLKWICHDHQIITNWMDYQTYMKKLLQESSIEQEQVLGGYKDWNRWIDH